MRIIEKDDFKVLKNEISDLIKSGKVFVHPTDTIYGIGCDATNSEAVKKVRMIKKRCERPFSVIAPSTDWIKENCELGKSSEVWLDKLPGPYTFILKLKNKNSIVPETNNGMETVGVRIPDHWTTELAAELGIPLITTSANVMGEDYMKDMESLDVGIKSKVDFILYEGEKSGSPSKVIDLTFEEPVTLRK